MQLSQIGYGKAPAVENMATDASMLEFGHLTGDALWRVYGWSEPAITFGYSQRWDWIQVWTEGFSGSCVRRSTGGGIVDHRADLTYSLTIPPPHHLFRKPARMIYEQLHQQLANVLMELGHPANLADCEGDCAEPGAPGQGVCFEAPEPYDVIHPLSGTKLAGAAMRRSRSGILIQGSLNVRHFINFSRIGFAQAFGDQLAIWLKASPVIFADRLPDELLKAELKRYGSAAWNQKR